MMWPRMKVTKEETRTSQAKNLPGSLLTISSCGPRNLSWIKESLIPDARYLLKVMILHESHSSMYAVLLQSLHHFSVSP